MRLISKRIGRYFQDPPELVRETELHALGGLEAMTLNGLKHFDLRGDSGAD
jgi:hypothetical protein